jgi:hypothetical protein
MRRSTVAAMSTGLRTCVRLIYRVVGTWEADDRAYARPIAAPLEQCAELLDVDLATIRQVAAQVQPSVRVDGTKVWSIMQLERQLRPQAYGRVRGDYIARRRVRAMDP